MSTKTLVINVECREKSNKDFEKKVTTGEYADESLG